MLSWALKGSEGLAQSRDTSIYEFALTCYTMVGLIDH